MVLSKSALGKKIGTGHGRSVYDYKYNSKYVVKVHKPGITGCNWREWYLWKGCPEIRKWLVPCKAISQDGKYLIQIKGKKISKRPKGYPETFNDVCRSNWVDVNGKILMCDYGNKIMYSKVTGREWNEAEEEKVRLETFN